jgi:hypothetical protein
MKAYWESGGIAPRILDYETYIYIHGMNRFRAPDLTQFLDKWHKLRLLK